MRTKILPEPVLDRVKANPRLYALGRSIRMGLGSLLPPRSLPELPGRVHFNDFMLDDSSPKGIAWYRESALNAISNIEASLTAVGSSMDDVVTWLDFGCGYGRVLRFLVDRVEPWRVSAIDVIVEGVDFCAAEFGITAIHSTAPLDRLRLGPFGFVYAISVLTHLNEENGQRFLELTRRTLDVGGIFMFTTHGRWTLDHLGRYGRAVVEMEAQIRGCMDEQGFAYQPYRHYGSDSSYGLAWHDRAYIEDAMRRLHSNTMELVRFEPHSLYHHQDVYAYRRMA
jgi:SAM-dependent methyltransferase